MSLKLEIRTCVLKFVNVVGRTLAPHAYFVFMTLNTLYLMAKRLSKYN